VNLSNIRTPCLLRHTPVRAHRGRPVHSMVSARTDTPRVVRTPCAGAHDQHAFGAADSRVSPSVQPFHLWISALLRCGA